MECGNRMEDMPRAGARSSRLLPAKWIGHRCINTTYGTYWDVDARDVTPNMNIPWLSGMDSYETKR